MQNSENIRNSQLCTKKLLTSVTDQEKLLTSITDPILQSSTCRNWPFTCSWCTTYWLNVKMTSCSPVCTSILWHNNVSLSESVRVTNHYWNTPYSSLELKAIHLWVAGVLKNRWHTKFTGWHHVQWTRWHHYCGNSLNIDWMTKLSSTTRLDKLYQSYHHGFHPRRNIHRTDMKCAPLWHITSSTFTRHVCCFGCILRNFKDVKT